ncbi:2-succinyl-5-enolpyruvyl-6-hydroxy-3-cyclohexene-1-carboxylic-acid synthase [Pontibacter sp. BT310]|uniref:2-succinyl-5-enolpyruvyl-6-hydroxy-3-cyclohexene-1-carboxylate synthase n=1 Tax=Pontibacter populi TaxID=890055 RepID=A0ABS6XFW7_9BACT|nr:2-succinyl-5-enolpyruvyl-6-hydroxy-3-cyclohexene-1-carboxylic-acid synthase [Pontibacter populi]MBJ6119152.1 2-succinyl-5-enolpyruvyl-6-hydroxy-3-cyclohexene-1-carboxylic-acid synthase [Pontibacter sp. BT310]MBR0571580.1 2-succinyl-5-enolpyruvyl-6-hydroxy-3-cyclohexene-1-carboxylic-acid synthase [Microvirga sp. STS03]MBW3366006.1 2-succinyl-5-enolpyruvyl-6-hydroxy-3-cyclohexene-1-carboxylic-acid synthase [Pontibacter populi]
MILQPVVNIAEICARKGVENVVLSPGSRCAPLTIAFARHTKLNVRTISDERAAAFIALGMALTTGKPTVLICTSGTAALNYAPAVAEAFFQQVPLLILTADRPPEWIDQLDGQTIRQQNVYGQHIKHSYTFPADLSHKDSIWHSERMVSEALNETIAYPAGPVHINIPLREPFYPAPGEDLVFDTEVKIIEEEPANYSLSEKQVAQLQQEISNYSRILIVAGQQNHTAELQPVLQQFTDKSGAVIVGDLIANLHELPETIRHQDAILACPDPEKLAKLLPDLLITFGKSVISKALKLYLRKYKPKAHWHIQPAGQVADTFQALTRIIRCTPEAFFATITTAKNEANYSSAWNEIESKAAAFLKEYTSEAAFSELSAVARIFESLPTKSNLHLANSMAVRYANIIGLDAGKNVEIYANRGTSGIDGSNSTTVGCALTSSNITTLLTGDMAFFYDRNGLWHNYLPQNLRIVILNNHAGGIFRLIDGPKQQPELEEFFETKQTLDAANTARDFGMNYTACSSLEELEQALPAFFSLQSGAGILEIFTDSKANAAAFADYKQALFKAL